MLDRWDAGQEGYRKRGMQERRDVEKERCKKGMQDRRDAGKEGFRKGGMQKGRMQDRMDAGQEKRKGGIREIKSRVPNLRVEGKYCTVYIVIFCQSITQDPFIKCMTGGACIVIIKLKSSHFKQILVLCSEKIHCQAK